MIWRRPQIQYISCPKLTGWIFGFSARSDRMLILVEVFTVDFQLVDNLTSNSNSTLVSLDDIGVKCRLSSSFKLFLEHLTK